MTAHTLLVAPPAPPSRRREAAGHGRTLVLDLSICALMAVSSVGLLLLAL